MDEIKTKPSVRKRADEIKNFRCKNLIAVIENPKDVRNLGTIIRNVNALGVEKTYVVDPRKKLPNDWQNMREKRNLSGPSASAIKWSFVKRFDSSDDCFDHLEKNNFVSYVTSPHIKGKDNFILHEIDYTENSKLAIWFGNESRGITDIAVNRSSGCIQIPMYGIIESLNLAVSSGIVLYEITKQRRDYQSKYKKRNRRRPIKSEV